MARAANAILASPGTPLNLWPIWPFIIIIISSQFHSLFIFCGNINDCVRCPSCTVEMFKVRMQGQHGAAMDKRLRDIMREMWSELGFKKGCY